MRGRLRRNRFGNPRQRSCAKCRRACPGSGPAPGARDDARAAQTRLHFMGGNTHTVAGRPGQNGCVCTPPWEVA
eukprot:3532100-Alexandrium_andersonii.AAC.1